MALTCTGFEREPQPEAAVSLRKMVTFVKSHVSFPFSEGKMAVFDQTESLVMSLVQRFHCCIQDGRACGWQHRQDEPSAMGWNRADQGQGNCSRMTTRSCSRGAAWSGRNGQSLKFIHIRFELEPNADAAQDKNEGVAARRSCVASSPHNQFWGSVIFQAI